MLPNFIQVQIGDTQIAFQLASSKHITQVRLQLNWTKTNDNVHEVYMPLYRSPIYIKTDIQIKLLTVGFPSKLYQNGSSFVYYVCVDNPPYNSLQINVSINNSCTVHGAVQSITLLNSCTQYQLDCPVSTATGFAQIAFSNNQQDIYQFQNQTVTATMVPYSSAVPTIQSLTIVSNTRTTVTVEVTASDTLKIHYVVADCGYATVSFLDVFNQNGVAPALNWSNPMFSVL